MSYGGHLSYRLVYNNLSNAAHNTMRPLKSKGVHCIKIRVISHVAADDISFAATFFKSPLTHFVAVPFQIEPATLGFDLVLCTNLKVVASILFLLFSREPRRAVRIRGSLFIASEIQNKTQSCSLFTMLKNVKNLMEQFNLQTQNFRDNPGFILQLFLQFVLQTQKGDDTIKQR